MQAILMFVLLPFVVCSVTRTASCDFHDVYPNPCKMSADEGKKAAGYRAIDEEAKSGMVIGIGSGSTVVFAAKRLGELYAEGKIKDIICIPTSFQSRGLIFENKLPLGNLEQNPVLDIAIDGADSIDPHLNLIKGGGAAGTQEKILATFAKRFIVIADDGKVAKYLGENWSKGLPIEVIPMAYYPIITRIREKYGANSELRTAVKKAGPVVTDNSNFIIDTLFDWQSFSVEQLSELNDYLLHIPGLVDTGLFLSMASIAYIGGSDGSVTIMHSS